MPRRNKAAAADGDGTARREARKSAAGGQWTRLQDHDDTPPPQGAAGQGARRSQPQTPATPHGHTPQVGGAKGPRISPRMSIPRPQLQKKMTAYLEQTERRLEDKRADAERERASRTIIDALDVARGTSAARNARYVHTEGSGAIPGRGSPPPAGPNGLCFRCVSLAGVTRNLETTVKSAVLHTFQQEDVIEVCELRRTADGQPRARTSCGWVSVISQNGKRLLEQVKEDRVSVRVNGPRHDDGGSGSGSPRHRKTSPRSGSPRGVARSTSSWDGSISERSDRSDASSDLRDTRSAAVLRAADGFVSGADLDDDSASEAGTLDGGSEYYSAEEEELRAVEEELEALELDETHVAARWGAETAAEGAPIGTRNSPTDVGLGSSLSGDGGGVVEVSDEGHPTSIEHPRITEQHMKHNHRFEWEKSLAAYLWRMVNDEMDDDFKVALLDDADVQKHPDGMPVIEFKVDIAVPRILQWIAGRKTCELTERCTVDWTKRHFTVECRTLNWTDKFSVLESSVYCAQPVGSGECEGGTDFYKVLRIEQFMAFPPVWVVNWVRDRWALKSREGRVQVDELCADIRFDDPVCTHGSMTHHYCR